MVQSAVASYHEIRDEKLIATSDGAFVRLVDVKPTMRVLAAAERDGQVMTGNESMGITGELPDLLERFPVDAMAEKAARDAVELLSAPYPEGGEATVILEPSLVGLLSHEAIGHTVEADFVLAGSITQGKVGTRVASDLITMVDAGTPELGHGPAGLLPVDDEGVATRRTVIIEDGVLRSYLHNRETAALFGVEPTGNGRAFEYHDEPLIRMRNTYILPGERSRDEIVSETADGWLLEGAGGGQADSNAEFVFGAQRAYRIEGGRVGKLHRGVTISGQAFRVLESVDAVSRDFAWGLGAGYCGKKQAAKVDAGGPFLRCRVILGGVQRGAPA
jgi:TldD protein